MTLFLNGNPHRTTATTITDLLAELTLPAETLLIEINGEPLHRSEWAKTPVAENDRLEFLQIAAGG